MRVKNHYLDFVALLLTRHFMLKGLSFLSLCVNIQLNMRNYELNTRNYIFMCTYTVLLSIVNHHIILMTRLHVVLLFVLVQWCRFIFILHNVFFSTKYCIGEQYKFENVQIATFRCRYNLYLLILTTSCICIIVKI